jgi:hypothetical protein
VSGPNLIRIAPGDVIDDFEIDEMIAEGSSSATFRATHRGLDRQVALKFVYPSAFSDDTDAIDAARADASRVARIEHPSVAAVYAAGTYEGGLYVASSLPKGRTLGELGSHHEITPAQTASVLADIAAALEDAHELGVVHRDLRPDCVTMDRWGHGIVRDFGMTRTSGRTGHVTRAEMLESLRYTAPELVLGRSATPATDVYGLAAVAVWCLTGSPPFRDRPPSEYVVFLTSARPPILTTPAGSPTPEINHAIAAAMDSDPAARPSAAAFAAALGDAIVELPASLRGAGSPLLASEAPALSALAPPAPASSRGASDATRVEHRRPLPVAADSLGVSVHWSTYAICVMVAAMVGLVGYFVGGLTKPEPPAPIHVAEFTIQPGKIWHRARASAGSKTDVQRLTAAGGQTATLRFTRDVRLPGDPVATSLLHDPKGLPRHVRSASTPLVTYATGDGLVVGRPTTKGTLFAVCSKPTLPTRCAALVVRADGPGKSVPVVPSKAVSDRLAEVLRGIDPAITFASLAKPDERATKTNALGNALEQAAQALAPQGADPGTAGALTRLSKALAVAGAATHALVQAMDKGLKQAFNDAVKVIRESERELARTLGAFERAGYQVAH